MIEAPFILKKLSKKLNSRVLFYFDESIILIDIKKDFGHYINRLKILVFEFTYTCRLCEVVHGFLACTLP